MKKRYLLTLISLFGWIGSAQAAIEIETDPIAFALKGHSAHIAFAGDRVRLDLGVYGLELPEDTNNPDYTVAMSGRGFKIDYFGDQIDGWFAGVQGGVANLEFTHADEPGESTSREVVNYGFRVGYRFGTDGFYLTPWFGLDRFVMQGDAVQLGPAEYQFQEYQPFPTVHLGYRF